MTLHIVEPTLTNYAGHCHSLVNTIVQAAPEKNVIVWAGKGSEKFWNSKVTLKPFFFKAIRRLQVFFLYQRLLDSPDKILIATAGTLDFFMIDLAAGKKVESGKVFLFVHWIGFKKDKINKLAKLAKRQPNLKVLCPTESGAGFFRDLGFSADFVPYPQNGSDGIQQQGQKFKQLIVAGAARIDKGFPKIVDLVVELQKSDSQLPISVQISTTHKLKHSNEILYQIDRLKKCHYPGLTLIENSLSPDTYFDMFVGAISVQPYLVGDFQNRVSGVTLDALMAGCPVVVTADTWLSEIVLEHNAGVATADLSPAGLKNAIDRILVDYEGYSNRALTAGNVLKIAHSGEKMIEIIFNNSIDSKLFL
jgi:glycosyltransferase involved in cell wall biosynthesis